MPAFLLALRPILAFLKPFWKYIAGAIIVVSLILFCKHEWDAAMTAAYKHGVADTVAADEVARANQQKQTDQLIKDLKTDAALKQSELEGKLHDSEATANSLRDKLRNVRVCTDSPSGSSSPVAGNSPPAPNVDGATGSSRPIETVGDDLVGLARSCKNTGDKLTTLQDYVKEVMKKVQQAETAYRTVVLGKKSTQ